MEKSPKMHIGQNTPLSGAIFASVNFSANTAAALALQIRMNKGRIQKCDEIEMKCMKCMNALELSTA